MPVHVPHARRRPFLRGLPIAVLGSLLLSAVPAAGGWQAFTALPSPAVVGLLQDREGRIWFFTRGGLTRYDGLRWRTFTRADGLPSDLALRGWMDRDGNLWFQFFITSSFVMRFDGRSWTPQNVPGGVNSMTQDREGRLWFGTTGGVTRLDGDGSRTFTTADGLLGSDVRATLEDRAGRIWAATSRGINRFDGATWLAFPAPDSPGWGHVTGMIEDRQGALWVGTSAGPRRFDGSSWTTHEFPIFPGVPGSSAWGVTFVLEDAAGGIWCGTGGGGVRRYESGAWRTYSTADGLASDNVGTGLIGRFGYPWLGTSRGLSRFDGAEIISYADAGAPRSVGAMLEDSLGNLWVSANAETGPGAYRFDGVSWRTFGAADGLADSVVWAIHPDRAGRLWFGTSSGVSCFDGAAWTHLSPPGTIAGNLVHAIAEGRDGALWFHTDRGLSRYDGSAWTNESWCGSYTTALFGSRSGDLWFGSPGEGVCRFDGVAETRYGSADGLASDVVLAIGEDLAGDVWLGHEPGGVSRFDGTTWRTYSTADGLAAAPVVAILGDRSGKVWLGTAGGGVSRFDGARWTRFTTADGLASDHVLAIAEDASGALWFGTDLRGASKLDGATWTTYTAADGLADDRIQAILRDRAGELWFATGRGVSRFDGARWTSYSRADGLADSTVISVLEDRTGSLWFGTARGGASRFDRSRWRTFNALGDGLIPGGISAVLQDRRGDLWFAGLGVSRYDGEGFTNYMTAEGPDVEPVNAIEEDQQGRFWFGTRGGASRFDPLSGAWEVIRATPETLLCGNIRALAEDRLGRMWLGSGLPLPGMIGCGLLFVHDPAPGTWRIASTRDGLPEHGINAILEDRSGILWFGTALEGVVRYDGTRGERFRAQDGLAGNGVSDIMEDRQGNLWVGTSGGASRFDGARWKSFTSTEGLPAGSVYAIAEDRTGKLWFGTSSGLARLEPDRVPPRTVMVSAPPALSSARHHTAQFVAGFGEDTGVEFSWSLDGGPWSEWSLVGAWSGTDLADGVHTLKARARDDMGNVDPRPTTAVFEVDASPPLPLIASPLFGGVVRDSVVVRGTAADARFRDYRLEVRSLAAGGWITLAAADTPVVDAALGGWSTRAFPEGSHELRLSVTDTLGVTGAAQIALVVDNHPPWADQTAPARITAIGGGDVYTTGGELHLYFPPRALRADAIVAITPLPESVVPDTLPGGAVRLLPGYELSWEGGDLAKPAALDLSLAVSPGARAPAPGGTPTLHVRGADSTWRRLGGTLDDRTVRLTAPLMAPGRYAVFAETGEHAGPLRLSTLSATPRAFSPRGAFASAEVAIGFSLGRGGSVEVRVYNRAGRLVKTLRRGEPMPAGANLVRWDGRDERGAIVEAGLYLVSVEALGERATMPVAVVP